MEHDDVIKWKHFPRNWPFVRGIHRSPVNSPHKGQWRGALMFSLICIWINDWVNNGEAGDLRRYPAHCDVTVMMYSSIFLRLSLVTAVIITWMTNYTLWGFTSVSFLWHKNPHCYYGILFWNQFECKTRQHSTQSVGNMPPPSPWHLLPHVLQIMPRNPKYDQFQPKNGHHNEENPQSSTKMPGTPKFYPLH